MSFGFSIVPPYLPLPTSTDDRARRRPAPNTRCRRAPRGRGCARSGDWYSLTYFGFVDVLHVDDDVLRAARDREQVVVRREHVVHAAGQLLVERRRDLRVRRIRQVENHDAVDAVRRALAREHAVAAVGRDRDVVDRAGVDLDRVGLHDVVQVGDVEDDTRSRRRPTCRRARSRGRPCRSTARGRTCASC